MVFVPGGKGKAAQVESDPKCKASEASGKREVEKEGTSEAIESVLREGEQCRNAQTHKHHQQHTYDKRHDTTSQDVNARNDTHDANVQTTCRYQR